MDKSGPVEIEPNAFGTVSTLVSGDKFTLGKLCLGNLLGVQRGSLQAT